MATATAPSRPIATPSVPYNPEPDAGEVNCRSWDQTYDKANYYSCKKIADFNSISIEDFFILNPEIDEDCSNVRPYTRYCVNGFLEPLRAYDGKCGPKNKDATCMSSGHGDCCNSSDCAIGICYEGDCWGHKIYTTDGFCGVEHGMRKCGGKIVISPVLVMAARPATALAVCSSTASPCLSSRSGNPLGCYKDLSPTTPRPLPDRVINNSGSLTIQICQTACRDGGYTIAGVENGNQGFCGYEIQEPATNIWVSQSECSKPCTGGNGSENCGAAGRMYIYQFAAPERKVWRTFACHKDLFPGAARPLSTVVLRSDTAMTIEACNALCQAGTY